MTLSDLAVAVETLVFAIAVARYQRGSPGTARPQQLRRWLVGLFASSAAASLAGAAAHGLSSSKDDPQRLAYWRVSFLAIGSASLSTWHIGTTLALRSSAARRLLLPVYVVHLVYLAVVLRTHPPFRLALALHGPSMVFLCFALLTRLRISGERLPATLAIASLAISTVAGIAQLKKLSLQPRWFDHNATFHLVQAIAFAVLVPAARGLIKQAK